MACSIGHFSKLKYDKCAYPEDLYDSTSPYTYIMDPDKIYNCNGSLMTCGPRSSYNGAGVSLPTGDGIAAAQQNIDIDSIMSNRNVILSKCKRGKVNPIDVRKIKTKNIPVSNDCLDGQHTKLSDPAMFYRGVPINRFYDLNKDSQANIFYDWAINTSLEAKDNFIPELPKPMDEVNMVPIPPNPSKKRDQWIPCSIKLDNNGNCQTVCQNNLHNQKRNMKKKVQ